MEMGKKEDIANEKKLSEVELAQIKYLRTKTLLLRILIGVVILFIIFCRSDCRQFVVHRFVKFYAAAPQRRGGGFLCARAFSAIMLKSRRG